MGVFEAARAARIRSSRWVARASAFLVLGGGLLLASVPDAVSAQEVGTATIVPIQVTGDDAARFTMIVLGDGYTADEMDRYRAHVDKHLNILWSTEPWRSYRNYVNIYSVEIISGESGVDCDPEVRERRTTPLSTTYRGGCENPNARGITQDGEAVARYAEMASPDYDQTLTIANTDTYGGIGGRGATTSGGNSLGPLITPHELGHSLGRLGDEYTYSARGVPGGVYDREEPNRPHFTLMTEDEMVLQQAKWWRWIGEESLSGGPIGRYEGGMSNVEGVWRPSKHSMMISLGYALDQVGLEQITEQMTAQTELIAASTATEVAVWSEQVIWVETAHPVYHELDITWSVDGREIDAWAGSPNLPLGELDLGSTEHTVEVAVVDPTPFVRDPGIRERALTSRRSWTVEVEATPSETGVYPHFTGSTQTRRPVAGDEVLYVETTHAPDQWYTVRWFVNGSIRGDLGGRRTLDLGGLGLGDGTHRVSASVVAAGPVLIDGIIEDAPKTLEWTVDNTPPTVAYELSEADSTQTLPDGSTHYFVTDQFTMQLTPTDDQEGYVVAEFRVNGDGWHHYYGWPDAVEGTPFVFTSRGTTIKELVYGSLSSEGLSPQPWEDREPGWGTHVIEYHGIDAAGNISEPMSFTVTLSGGEG